jgi:hypothetical protein
VKLGFVSVTSGLLALVLGACAIANTPLQDLAYERWARCAEPPSQLRQVDVDGRITFVAGDPSGRETISRCLAEAGRTGPRLPEPQVIIPAGGV